MNKPRIKYVSFNFIPCELRLPTKSGEYMTIDNNCNFNIIYYSVKHKRFNCFDEFTDEHAKELTAFDDVVAWAVIESKCFKFDGCKTVKEIRDEIVK